MSDLTTNPISDLSPTELETATIAALIDKDPSDLTKEERLLIIRKLRTIRGDWVAAAQAAKRDGKRTQMPKAAKAPKAPKLTKEQIGSITLDDLGL